MSITPQQLIARLEEQSQQIDALQKLWKQLFPEFAPPASRQFRTWLNIPYDFDTVVHGLEKAMQFLNKRILEKQEATMPVTQDDIVRYASGCMKKHKADQSCESA